MKTLKYLFFILCLPLFAGCFEDETTVDTVRISEISIDTLKMQKVYNIDQNEELLIPTEGLVSQSERQLPLTYEWEVNYKFYSDSSALRFTGNGGVPGTVENQQRARQQFLRIYPEHQFRLRKRYRYPE